MEQENEKYGNLFGSIDLLSEDHLEIILSTMDSETALYYIIESVKSAHRKMAIRLVKLKSYQRRLGF